MDVIEEAANMLLIQSEEGLIQKPNNARTRLKYGARDLDEHPELFERTFEDGAITFGSTHIYPTENEHVFVTVFSTAGDTLPVIYQNPPALGLEYLSELEEFLSSDDSDAEENFEAALRNKLTLSVDDKSDSADLRPSVMNRWFKGIDNIAVNEDYIEINGEITLTWDGVAIKKDSNPTQMITEFYPSLNFLYKPELNIRWGDNITFTESEIYIIQRVTRLSDKLAESGLDAFDELTVKLPE